MSFKFCECYGAFEGFVGVMRDASAPREELGAHGEVVVSGEVFVGSSRFVAVMAVGARATSLGG